MTKTERAIRRLVEQGWSVNEDGSLVDADGEVRKCRVKKGKHNPNTGYSEPSYLTFNVKEDGVSLPIPVHKLAAFQKDPETAFAEGVHVRHLNGDSLDNRPDNILAGTVSENMSDINPIVRYEHAKTAARSQRRFSDAEVVGIRASEESTTALAKRLGCSKSTISDIRNLKLY